MGNRMGQLPQPLGPSAAQAPGRETRTTEPKGACAMSSSTQTFQISAEQAAIYESTFVPAIFADWAAPLADAVGLEPGQTVLDVACGIGILARTAAARVAPTGKVIGLD